MFASNGCYVREVIEPSSRSPWWHRSFAGVCGSIEPPTKTAALAQAATLMSTHRSALVATPADVDATMRRLDRLAKAIARPEIETWRRHLFVECGFAGNGNDYHDVRNSFLPDVLERRVGIPISLAVVGIVVAERIGLQVWGVGMPGHFLLGACESDHQTVYVDAFNGGELLDVDGCAARFAGMFGRQQPFEQRFLEPASTTSILVRMLANLKGNYARTRDLEGLAAVLRMRTCLPDASLDEERELIRLLDATGSWHEADHALAQIEASRPNDAMILQLERDRLDARLN